MKKLVLFLVLIISISTTSFAMKFYQPVQVGYVEDHGIVGGGYKFKGTVSNTGTLYEWQKDKYYKNGVVAFGKDNDLIYLHYNDKNYFDEKSIRSYGGKNLENTFRFTQAYGCDFNQIKTDSNITFYMVHEWQFDVSGDKYSLLGRKSDGTFVKYFDTWSISEKYFGKQFIPNRGFYDGWHCDRDTIIIEYARFGERGKKIKIGEFRFKWDDKAQWFGVEQVVY